jgi:hypothetical protein
MKMKGMVLLLALGMTACMLWRPAAAGPLTPAPGAAATDSPAEPPSQGPAANPYAPQSADSDLTPGEVFLREQQVVARESDPPQISLSLSGELSTPCHQLRVWINEPDEDSKINVEVYSVVDPSMVCIQVPKSFDASIGLGAFPRGRYSVWVNGEKAGEFES